MMLESIKKIDWNDAKYKGNGVHSLHPYFAKFSPSIPYYIIKSLTEKGALILDPYCGSGTTLVESIVLGRNSIGIDANPIACLMSRVKTYDISEDEIIAIKKVVRKLNKDIDIMYHNKKSKEVSTTKIEIPEFHNRDYWFNKNVQYELSIISKHIQSLKNEKIKDILKLALSRIIVKVSNQQSESRYKRVYKKIAKKESFLLFSEHTSKILANLLNLREFADEGSYVKIFNNDSRNIDFIDPASVDLIVTSPPYLNSWDYGLYHKFRFKWLDMDLKGYEEKEIGKHLRRNGEVLKRYKQDMYKCMGKFSEVLKSGAFCVIVNSNSLYDKKDVNTNKIIIGAAQKQSMQLMEVIDKKVYGPHFGLKASLISKNIANFGSSQKIEQILFFRKE